MSNRNFAIKKCCVIFYFPIRALSDNKYPKTFVRGSNRKTKIKTPRGKRGMSGKYLMDCQADYKQGLYPCNRWDCNSCFRKKAYWLREQAISFVYQLPHDKIFFTVLKHFKNPRDCHDLMRYIIEREKTLKPPCSAKFEYFYVIANHGFSGWHIHLISNRDFHEQAQYCEPAQSKKASALYMVTNLERSRFADYEGVRRYGSSRLLYKHNKKTSFKSRKKAQWLIVLMALVQRLINIELSRRYPPPYRAYLGYTPISQPLRYYRGTTEELTFRKPRDDLVGESEWA
jgi:hypothetical protein